MPEFLETTVDKFIFRVATDRYYSRDGLWAKAEGNRIRIGMTDFLQQRSGDVAFAEVKTISTQLSFGDEVSVIETIKVDIALYSPVSGTVLEVNPAMDDSPEVINQDPYGEGWMAVIEFEDWEADKRQLMEPQAYFSLMRGQAEEEAKKFAEELEKKSGLPIIFVDESFTSEEAMRNLKEQGISLEKSKLLVDQEAARIILEEYLNSQRISDLK